MSTKEPAFRTPEPEYLNREDTARYLRAKYGVRISASTLARAGGPEFRRLRGTVIYAITAIDAWAESQMTRPVRTTADLKLLEGQDCPADEEEQSDA